MNQVFAGGLALIIALIIWSSKKQFKVAPFLTFQKDSLSKVQSPYSLVIEKRLKHQTALSWQKKHSQPSFNQPELTSIERKKQLTKLISSNPNDRLLAIQIASEWNNKKALPFLKRGLKDSDRRVVIASATAISFYKGKTIEIPKGSQVSRPPRNVSLMR